MKLVYHYKKNTILNIYIIISKKKKRKTPTQLNLSQLNSTKQSPPWCAECIRPPLVGGVQRGCGGRRVSAAISTPSAPHSAADTTPTTSPRHLDRQGGGDVEVFIHLTMEYLCEREKEKERKNHMKIEC